MDFLIKDILSIEKYEENSFQKINNIILEKSKIEPLINHLNIVLVGRSGVGKTTLINSFFNYDKEKRLKTQFGAPCTMGEPEYYTSENMPLFRLADSRGIDLKYDIQKLFESVYNFINTKLQTNNPDEFVHCIWYCISGTRFEDIEIELTKLKDIYKSKSIPIIIVYTRAIDDIERNLMRDFIKNRLNFEYDFIPVLAKEKIVSNIVVKPFGINELKEISFKRAKEAPKTAFFANFIFQAKNEIETYLDKKLKNQLDSFIETNLKKKLETLKEVKCNEDIYEDLKKLLSKLISININNDTRILLKDESKQLISRFSTNILKSSFQNFSKNFNDYIPRIKEDMINNFSQIIGDDISSLDNESIKKIINNFFKHKKEIILHRLWFLLAKNIIKDICSVCADLLKKNSEIILRNIPEKEDFKESIDKMAQNNFDAIKDKLAINK